MMFNLRYILLLSIFLSPGFVFVPRPTSFGLYPLRETVEQGIAWQYPGDAGISTHPSVVFAADFESGSLEEMQKDWGHISNREGKVLSFSKDVPQGSPGKKSLQMSATRGQNEGGELYKVFDAGWDKIYLRFYTKFAKDHGIYHHFVALRGFTDPLPYPSGGAGKRPENHFSVTIEPSLSLKTHSKNPLGIWKFYNYWPEMHSWQSPEGKPDGTRPNPYYGNNFQPQEPAVVPRGEWVAVEIMLKLNSSPQTKDGEIALWINGKPMIHFTPGFPVGYFRSGSFIIDSDHPGSVPFEGFLWRKDMDVKINVLRLQHYVSDRAFNRTDEFTLTNPDVLVNTSQANVLFDHVVMAKEYIGLMKY